MNAAWLRRLKEVNGELWLIFSLFVISGMLNYLTGIHEVVLDFFLLPTLFSAYFYGKRHATMTATASICLVVIISYFNPRMFVEAHPGLADSRWFGIAIWAGMLIVTAYTMGTLYDRNEEKVAELRETYYGVLMILRQFVAKDKYTQNHSYRVSIYATKIAAALGLDKERIEDIRAASLLHDIGKLDISRELLYKAARLTGDEFKQVQNHVAKGGEILEPVGGTLRRILPIILAHHDKFDGSGYGPSKGLEIPIEARVISVADAFDALTSDRPYRKGVSPYEARQVIVDASGTDFDPEVVRAFTTAFSSGHMEVPELVV